VISKVINTHTSILDYFGYRKDLIVKVKNTAALACVAGGSGCARETFCGEAANSLSGYAREGIFASGEAASEIPAFHISYPF